MAGVSGEVSVSYGREAGEAAEREAGTKSRQACSVLVGTWILF